MTKITFSSRAGYTPSSGNPGLGANATSQMVPAAVSNRASAQISAAETANLVYADGTPYVGAAPGRFGCTFSGVTTIPQGSGSDGSLGSVPEVTSSNYQWQSEPFVAVTRALNGPHNLTPPATSAQSAALSTPVTVANGTWNNANTFSYQWQWCTDFACKAPQTTFPAGAVQGANTNTVEVLSGDAIGGGYLRAVVTGTSSTGATQTAYSNIIPVATAPAITYVGMTCPPDGLGFPRESRHPFSPFRAMC